MGIAAGVVRCLVGLAGVAAARAEAERAAQLYAAAWSLAESVSVTFAELDQAERERALQQLRGQLGDAQFEAATRAGETLSLERAIRLALAT